MDGEHLIETYGVRVSHRIIPHNSDDSTGFCVPVHQAKWAEYLLLRSGYPLTSPLFDPRHRKMLERAHERSRSSRPPSGSKSHSRRGITDRWMHAIDAFLTGGKSSRDRRLVVVERRPKPPTPQPKARRRKSWLVQLFRFRWIFVVSRVFPPFRQQSRQTHSVSISNTIAYKDTCI